MPFLFLLVFAVEWQLFLVDQLHIDRKAMQRLPSPVVQIPTWFASVSLKN